MMIRSSIVLLLCLAAAPGWAKQAQFAEGVLTIDTVNYNNATYQTQLVPVAGSNPIAFILTAAQAVSTTTDPAATVVGTTLTIPNVLVNDTERLSVKMMLVGQNPVRFQVLSYSSLRNVTLDTANQTLTPGKAFYVKYSGGALSASKIKLSMGSSAVATHVVDNVIAVTVPVGMQGNQTLSIELDGDTFRLPLTIEPGVAVVNPKSYVGSFINTLALDLQRLGLPADLLDQNALSAQLASMTESDAQQAALLIRENIAALSALTSQLQGQALALSIFTPTANLSECERLMVNYLRATSVMSASIGVVVVGGVAATALPLSGPFALAAAVATASAIVSGELAAQYQDRLLSLSCLHVENATIGTVQELRSEVTVAQTLNVYESRAQSIRITELQRLANQEVRGDFLSASTTVKASLERLKSLLTSLGFSASSRLQVTVKNLMTRLKTDDSQQISTNSHKFSIRAISDSRVSGSVLTSASGALTLLLDRKDTDMPEGQSISFTIELYNSVDDVSIKVPVKLNGASMLEDLKLAVVGRWKVTRTDNGTVYDLELRQGGTGVYLLPGPTCPNGVTTPTGCEYKTTWTITKSGTKYLLFDHGFWHPGYNDPALGDRTSLTLPLTGFVTHEIGNVANVAIRYVKQ
ncbi:MAG: hypothetical protein V4751_04865 [Pseudomonadota bacterium]